MCLKKLIVSNIIVKFCAVSISNKKITTTENNFIFKNITMISKYFENN